MGDVMAGWLLSIPLYTYYGSNRTRYHGGHPSSALAICAFSSLRLISCCLRSWLRRAITDENLFSHPATSHTNRLARCVLRLR